MITKYYELRWKNKDELGTVYSLDLSGSPEEIKKIQLAIQKNSLNDGEEVTMEIDLRTGTKKKRLGDIVYWQKGVPNAHQLIVSEDLLDYLKTLNLPTHKIYKINIQNADKDIKTYFIFHILTNVFQEINFPEQRFYKRSIMNDSSEGWLEKGAIRDYNDFLATRSDLMSKYSYTLFFDEIHYKNSYDLIWGFPSSILVNASIKEKIEARKFALNFLEFNEYQVHI